jgi:hypothetical protein
LRKLSRIQLLRNTLHARHAGRSGKYERAFFGLEKGVGEIEKKPDNPEAQHDHHH